MSPRRIAALAAAIVALGGIAFGGAVAVTHSTSLLSQAGNQAPADRPRRGEPGWLRDLNLSTDQVQKIQAIRSQYKEPISKQKQAMRQAQQELRELMASNASAEQVRQKFNQTKTLRQQLADTQFESMLAMREVLNPEQRRTFADRMQKHRDDFKGRTRDRVEQRDRFEQ